MRGPIEDYGRGRIEDYALLWWLVIVVAVLSVLPIARLLLEGSHPAEHRRRKRSDASCRARRPGPQRVTAW